MADRGGMSLPVRRPERAGRVRRGHDPTGSRHPRLDARRHVLSPGRPGRARPEAVVLGWPPRGGRFRTVAPFGGGGVAKAPSGPQPLVEVELTLTTLQLLLLADVLPHPGLVQAHRTDAVTRRPEAQPRQPTLVEQLPVDPHGALALQET